MAKKSSLDEVEQVFQHIDANGDGKISPSELGTVVQALDSNTSTEEVHTMIEQMDSNHDGFVDFNEFADFYRSRGGGDQELRDAFEMYDLDGNGLISASELHLVLKKLGDKCSVRDCNRMIRAVDVDGDGCVSFEEFKKMMGGGAKTPGLLSPPPTPSPKSRTKAGRVN